MVWCIGICFKTVGRTKEFLLLCNARNIFFFKSKNKKKKKLLHPKMIIINKPMTTWLKATCFTSEQRKVCYTSEFNKYIFFSLDELPSQTHFPFHSCVFSLQKYHIFNCIALPWYLAQYNSLRASASLYHAHNMISNGIGLSLSSEIFICPTRAQEPTCHKRWNISPDHPLTYHLFR